MKIFVNSPKYKKNLNSYNINDIRKKIKRAYDRQQERYKSFEIRNSQINSNIICEKINISYEIEKVLDIFVNKYNLSKRSHDNIIKVARTIADYENFDEIKIEHIYEALSYQKQF